MRVFVFLTLFVALNAHGMDTDKVAHLGVSYMATTVSYGVFKTVGVREKWLSLLFSSLLVASVTSMKELGDLNPDGQDVAHNLMGVGLSVGTVLIFDF